MQSSHDIGDSDCPSTCDHAALAVLLRALVRGTSPNDWGVTHAESYSRATTLDVFTAQVEQKSKTKDIQLYIKSDCVHLQMALSKCFAPYSLGAGPLSVGCALADYQELHSYTKTQDTGVPVGN